MLVLAIVANAFALAAFSTLAEAQESPPYNQVWVSGDYFEPMTRGLGVGLFPSTSTITVQRHSGDDGVRVIASGPSSWYPNTIQTWQLDFAPVAGQSFTVGFYPEAEKYPMNMPGHPGMDVSGGHAQCGRLLGRFDVLEIERDSTGEIVRLAIDFAARCEFVFYQMYGNVRINANTSWDPPPLMRPDPDGIIYLYREPGEPFNVSSGLASAVWGRVSAGNIVQFSDGSDALADVANKPVDLLALQAPGGAPLTPGVYENARKVGTTTGPGIDFQYSQVTCADFTGRFVVHEADIDPYGFINKFAADFELHCNGAIAALYGAVRYNSAFPVSDPRGSGYTAPLPDYVPVTTASGRSPSGAPVNLSIAGLNASCTLASANFHDPSATPLPSAPPESITYPQGYLDFTTENCGSGQPVTFTVDTGQALPPTAQWWKYGPTPDNHASHWYTIPSTVDGSKITFTITDGQIGDDDLMMNGSISDLGMVAIPNGPLQDLWWSGPGENGWGMSIVQHRDVLFANLFVYDSQGAPTWYVMPSGSWDSTHTIYTGNLYLPKGAPFFAYDATKFDIGASVGQAKFTFSSGDPNNASFDYTISGVTGHKNITRLLFGPQSPPLDKPLGDLWWAGGAQNGWGLAVLQQHSTLFALWFTYDANGKPTWFVMPGGSWAANGDYRGAIFRAAGPPWLGVTYDVTRHQLTQVGTFRFLVTGDGANFEYTADGKSGTIALTRIPF